MPGRAAFLAVAALAVQTAQSFVVVGPAAVARPARRLAATAAARARPMLAKERGSDDISPVAKFVRGRWDDASPLEMRLDVTMLWCHVLARASYLESTTQPLKDHPTMTMEDWYNLLNICASASALTFAWVAVGLIFGQFSTYAKTNWQTFYAPTAATVLIAGLFWQAAEVSLDLAPLHHTATAAGGVAAVLGLGLIMGGIRTLAGVVL